MTDANRRCVPDQFARTQHCTRTHAIITATVGPELVRKRALLGDDDEVVHYLVRESCIRVRRLRVGKHAGLPLPRDDNALAS